MKSIMSPIICYYPVINDPQILKDHIARAGWYLNCIEPTEIIFVVEKGIKPDYEASNNFDPLITPFIEKIKPKIKIIHVADKYDDFGKYVDKKGVDIIMVWDQTIIDDSDKKREFQKFRENKPFWKVDNSAVRFEGSFYIRCGLENFPDKEAAIEENRIKFHKFADKVGHYKKSYVFGTGPMVAKYGEFDYSDGLSIICNSIILDNEMMEHIKPKILCFGDPIFHFGPSRYAAEFRNQLRDAVQKYDLIFLISFNFYRIFTYNFPEFKDITIAVPLDYDKPANFNILNDFYINPFSNVLTMLMLPAAATFSDEVNMLGTDGRKESENKYFWKHNEKTQFNDQMDNIKIVHPSFFNIDYNAYYDSHKKSMEEYLLSGESVDKKYKILTPTYIPCLRKRHIDYDQRIKKIDKNVAVFDPNFRDIGHNTYFNLHVLRLLSKFFHEVFYFETSGVVRDAFNDKPINVEIVQMSESLNVRDETDAFIKSLKTKHLPYIENKKLVHEFEKNIYKKLWAFIESYDCDMLFFTSEGSIGNPITNALYSYPPNIPFMVTVHIIWHVLKRKNDQDFRAGMNKAECLFAFENYLVDQLRDYNSNTYRFPYKIYEDTAKFSKKIKSSNIRFGTIGIINDRRNLPFILDSLSKYTGPNIEYYLCGKPVGKHGKDVQELAENFSKKTNVMMNTKFEYLSDEEFERLVADCDFILIAYDKVRVYQAPGIVYQAAKSLTPLIVPNIEPFTVIEHEYPGIFIFYDNLSTESLNCQISALAIKDNFYKTARNNSLEAMKRFLVNNAENVQLEYLQSIFNKIEDTLQSKALISNKLIETVNGIITALCEKYKRFEIIFDDTTKDKIFNSDSILEKLSKDVGIQRLLDNDDIITEILNSGVINALLLNEDLFQKLSNEDIADCIRNDEDIILKICSPALIENIFGNKYNSMSRTDRFYGFWGKLIGAYEIYKVARDFNKIDKPRLQNLKDKYKGRRAFILCNGPSLNKIDLSLLKDEITIGMNGLYLMFEKMDFKPTFYVTEDDLVAEDRKNDLNTKINGPIKLFSQRLGYCLNRAEDVIFLRHNATDDPWKNERKFLKYHMRFSEDISIVSFSGNTVTYTCLQVAFHLGIREVYIIGADHNYIVPERYKNNDDNENYVIDPQEEDVNHFHPSYFGTGFRWHNPKVHMIERSYENAKKVYEANGGGVFNASAGGYLETFKRVKYLDLFNKGYKNKSFEKINEAYKKTQINYKGKTIDFDGNFEMNPTFKRINESFEIDFILRSDTYDGCENVFNDICPPMPLYIIPLNLYQVDKNFYRIKYEDLNYELFFKINSWNKIKITYDHKKRSLTLEYNNKIVNTVKNVKTSLAGICKLGKGVKNRFWKGKIGYLKIVSITASGDKEVVLHIDNKKLKEVEKDLHDDQPIVKIISGNKILTRTNEVNALNYSLQNKTSNFKFKRNSLFIIGNGPSLRDIEFQKLQKVEWIGMNAAYRYWEKINIYPDYYICMDTIVIQSHKENIYKLIQERMVNGIKLFFLRKILLDFYPDLTHIPEVVFLEDYYKSPYFEGFNRGITTGSFSALLGAMLGFKQLYLIGIDLNYIQKIQEADNIGGYVLAISETPKNNPNYFFDDYQQKGDRYNVPDSSMPDLHYLSWVKVKERLEQFGIYVFNCNQNSQVDIFNYANANEIL